MPELKKITLTVEGMTCAVCAQSVEKTLKAQPGVKNAAVNFAGHSASIEYDIGSTNLHALQKAVNNSGYELITDENITREELEKLELDRVRKIKNKFIVSVIFSLPVFILSMFFMHVFKYEHGLLFLLSVPVLVFSGADFFVHSFKKIKRLETNMDTLVALSTGIAFLYSSFNVFFPDFLISKGITPHLYFESATVIITFILLGKYLEEKSKSKASSAIKNLLKLQPDKLIVVRDNTETEISSREVQVNDIIIIKPGSSIPVDGKVIMGESFVDESMITGEPLSVSKATGDNLYAGTVNQKGSLQMVAEKTGNKTLLAQIISQVRDAQMNKPPIQKLADKIAGIFVPVVISIALLTFVLWVIFGPSPSLANAIISAITVLIIACPCALGLATPTALITGIGRGAENGILIRNAEGLEIAHQINAVVFDKTGTITKGKPEVTDAIWFSQDHNLKNTVYAMEQLSEHPLAAAICNYIKPDVTEKVQVSKFESITAKGITASINGTKYFAGNAVLLKENKIKIENTTSGNQTGSMAYFADENECLAMFIIADEIRETSRKAVSELHTMGIETFLLTGDNQVTAEFIAKQAGISNITANVLPTEKTAFIEQLQLKGLTVAMTGDGINDAAALAKANLGIAMASGSDISVQNADIILLKSDLLHVVKAINLSKTTYKIIRQNLFWAFFYNVISIPVAAGILYPFSGFLLSPMIAGAAMAMSSVSVVSNSLRLKKIKL